VEKGIAEALDGSETVVEVERCGNSSCANFGKIVRVKCPVCGKYKVRFDYRGNDISLVAMAKDYVFWGCVHDKKVHITPILRSLCE
jgi:hypothetical protein